MPKPFVTIAPNAEGKIEVQSNLKDGLMVMRFLRAAEAIILSTEKQEAPAITSVASNHRLDSALRQNDSLNTL